MNQEEIKKLAIECGFDPYNSCGLSGESDIDMGIYVEEYPIGEALSKYTAAVEAPLQARIAQLEDALNSVSTSNYMPPALAIIIMRILSESPSTWLSDHNKEVAAKERERCAVLCDGMYGAMRSECAAAIRELK